MTDLEIRLRDVGLAEPPLGFDPDEVVDRAAEHARRRSAAALVTVITVTAVVLVASWLVPAPTAVPPASPSPAEQARIRQALADAITRVLPGLRSLTVRRSASDPVGPDRMSTTAEFADAAGRRGGFQLTVRGAGAAYQVLPADRLCPRSGPAQHCVRFSRPDGVVLVLSGLDYTDGTVVVRRDLNGFLYHQDGSTVMITGGEGFSLSDPQLVEVITDPAFVLR